MLLASNECSIWIFPSIWFVFELLNGNWTVYEYNDLLEIKMYPMHYFSLLVFYERYQGDNLYTVLLNTCVVILYSLLCYLIRKYNRYIVTSSLFMVEKFTIVPKKSILYSVENKNRLYLHPVTYWMNKSFIVSISVVEF
jgi:hypothetical protein